MNRIKAKSKVDINDAKAAMGNHMSDSEAMNMLRDIVGDEFPDLDLKETNLADAVNDFGGEIERHQAHRKQKRKLDEIEAKMKTKPRKKKAKRRKK